MRLTWTDTGNRTFEYIVTCCQGFYSRKTLKALNNSIKHAESLLPDNPLMGAIEPIADGLEYEYRYIVLNNPFKLIYLIYDDCVYIADIWDTRRSSENLLGHLS